MKKVFGSALGVVFLLVIQFRDVGASCRITPGGADVCAELLTDDGEGGFIISISCESPYPDQPEGFPCIK